MHPLESQSPAALTPLSQEHQRLQALAAYQILDTAPEPSFDRSVALAARLFRVPIALVSLVDRERQWFKACYGLDFQQTDRSLSFCAHAVEADEVLVVPDATLDPRFQANTLVTDHHIRFYAGAPLRTPAGHSLGTLCLLDVRARAGLDEEERRTLQDLADSVVSELELRRLLSERTHSEARLSAVLTSALDAIITIDAQSRVTEWNPAAGRLFGYLRSEALGQALSNLIIPPELRDAHQQGMARYLRSGEGPILGHRIEVPALRRDGTTFPCELTITPFLLGGQPMFTAYLRDLTEQQAARAALATSHNLLGAVVEGMPEAVYVKDLDLRYAMINAAGAAHLGLPGEEILGRTDEEVLPPVTAQRSRQRDLEVLRAEQPLTYDVEDLLPGGRRRTFRSTKSVYRDAGGQVAGLIGLSLDVTDQKANEALIQQQNQTLEQRVGERTRELEATRNEMLVRLARAAEYRDDDTGEHVQRVARTAGLLARVLGLPAAEVALIERAAPLHDVGKIGIPDGILLKPGRLDGEELVIMRRHAQIGAGILADAQSDLVRLAEEIALNHHERWDGCGYPHGLRGEAIPLAGRIVAVADVLDALTSERPYKRAWPFEEAVQEIQTQAGRQFDPRVVEALLELIRSGALSPN